MNILSLHVKFCAAAIAIGGSCKQTRVCFNSLCLRDVFLTLLRPSLHLLEDFFFQLNNSLGNSNGLVKQVGVSNCIYFTTCFVQNILTSANSIVIFSDLEILGRCFTCCGECCLDCLVFFNYPDLFMLGFSFAQYF